MSEPRTTDELRNKKEIATRERAQPISLAEIKKNVGLAMLDPGTFEHMQRVGKMLANSQLVPKHFQGKEADCSIGVQMAVALDSDPMTIMQNMYIVHGTPGFSSKFAIALANKNGPFRGGIKFKDNGKPTDDDAFAVTAYATRVDTNEVVERTVSLKTAKDEGWYKNNAKYKSMPDQMLSYRAAMFLIRLYCPEVLLGMKSIDEVYDVGETIEGEIVYGDPLDTGVDIPVEHADKPSPNKDTEDKTEPAPATEEEPEPEPEQEEEPEKAGPSFQDICEMIMKCDATNKDDIATVESVISGVEDRAAQKKLRVMLEGKIERADSPEEGRQATIE